MDPATRPWTERIIGCALAVHTQLGPGSLESVYEGAMSVELRKAGLPFARQVEVPILYDGVEVGLHRLDLVVAGCVVVELKAVRELAPVHFKVVRSYLQATRCPVALLLNFSQPRLEFRRLAQ